MVLIVLKSKYPSHKVDEVVKVYFEVTQKYPPDATLATAGPLAIKQTAKGIKAITIWEVEPGKFEAAYNRTAEAMAMFRNIEGYEYSIEAYSTAAESLASIGIELPQQ